MLLSAFLIGHFELFRLKQVLAQLSGPPMPAPVVKMPLCYRGVRHPLYFGFLLAYWTAPSMTAGHLLFALATTGNILIALFGDQDRRYRAQVGMLISLPSRNVVEVAAWDSRPSRRFAS